MCLARRHVLALVACFAFSTALGADTPEPGAKVYLLRMKNGFDLHLANRLTQTGVLVVVTDPTEAEFVLTENVGTGFEEAMKLLYPPPPVQAPETGEGDEDEGGRRTDLPVVNRYMGARPSTFGRAEGTLFLVRRTDSTVIWSTFLDRRDTRDSAQDKHAGSIVKRLEKWFRLETAARNAELSPGSPD